MFNYCYKFIFKIYEYIYSSIACTSVVWILTWITWFTWCRGQLKYHSGTPYQNSHMTLCHYATMTLCSMPYEYATMPYALFIQLCLAAWTRKESPASQKQLVMDVCGLSSCGCTKGQPRSKSLICDKSHTQRVHYPTSGLWVLKWPLFVSLKVPNKCTDHLLPLVV